MFLMKIDNMICNVLSHHNNCDGKYIKKLLWMIEAVYQRELVVPQLKGKYQSDIVL